MEKRSIDLRRELPPEIKAHDVMDAGGLNVGADSKSGACYVYFENLKVDPGETVSFDVKIRDKWNVNAYRIDSLRAKAADVLSRVSERKKYESVENMLKGLIDEVAQVENEQGPETLGERYVAFYRRQSERLDLIEQKIHRVEAALRPIDTTTKWGFDVKPPSMKTTWMIIYIILGFLAVVSLLFFLRWFGKTQAERLSASAEESEDRRETENR